MFLKAGKGKFLEDLKDKPVDEVLPVLKRKMANPNPNPTPNPTPTPHPTPNPAGAARTQAQDGRVGGEAQSAARDPALVPHDG